jgi:transcriptional regulator with XRE-family HTH domain
MAVYENIRNLREDNDLTQSALADILHISQRAYSHYENGTREIPLSVLIDLADYYNVSIDYLLGVTNIKTRAGRMKTHDSVTVYRSSSPELYEISSNADKFSRDGIDRLFTYYKELLKQEKKARSNSSHKP